MLCIILKQNWTKESIMLKVGLHPRSLYRKPNGTNFNIYIHINLGLLAFISLYFSCCNFSWYLALLWCLDSLTYITHIILWKYFWIVFLTVTVISRFVPYIGIVTILMNDYPKFKVSLLTSLHQSGRTQRGSNRSILLWFNSHSMLFSSCWVSSSWSIGSEGPEPQDSRRINHVQEASVMPFKTETKLTQPALLYHLFWTFCRNVDRVFTFEKNPSFKVFLRGN